MILMTSRLSILAEALGPAEPWYRELLGMGTGETFMNIADGLSSLATAGAVIVGGWWAYLKFLKGRTYKPRLSVHMAGQWRTVDSEPIFHVRIRVTNIGASKVSLRQHGTGLRVSLPADEQDQHPNVFVWEPVVRIDTPPAEPKRTRTFSILEEHAWIEPGETISEDLLINLVRDPTTVMLETRLVWSPAGRAAKGTKHNVVVFARQIIPPEATIDDNSAQQPDSG